MTPKKPRPPSKPLAPAKKTVALAKKPRPRSRPLGLAKKAASNALVLTAPQALMGCDTSGAITSQARATALAALGYKFIIRYVLVQGGLVPKPLTVAEAGWLRAAGIAIGIIQAIPAVSQMTAANGTRDGAYAASQAKALGYPPGCVLWFDFEGGGFPADNILIAYLNNWANAVQAQGYPAGLYNGPQNALTGAQIQALVFPHYWKADSLTNDPSRGYQVKQLTSSISVPAIGTAIDVDQVYQDNKGDFPTFWAAA